MKVVLDYERPTIKDSLRKLKPNGLLSFLTFFLNYFPIFKWIHRYNLSWLFQDAIAGITVGLLLVPQSLAYSSLAGLSPQYGLYSSFIGVTIYCLFGTSKDISIGPITVVSLLVGEAIHKVTEAHPDITGPEVAVCLSLFCGIIVSLIGIIKLGVLVDFISGPAIAGYMSGSAITIGLGQWPKLFGLTGVDTHQPPYLIFYQFFKQFATVHIDAAFGVTSLIILYVIKSGTGHLAAKLPKFKKPLFFMGIMRSGLIVIICTLISFFINLNLKPNSSSPFKIIKEVPSGFDAIGVPFFRFDVISECMGVLPSIIIILILEHVSVAKSFGRINDYEIDPNQEILVIGISNIVGSFIGAYPCTGAFSRTAVMARSGSRTPLAGVFTGLVVILALYVLTPAFHFIPEAVLAAVVIHAVSDLVSGPSYILELYNTSILELLIFITSVCITCFIDVETAIYVSVGLSLIIMLLKLSRPPVKVLARSPLKGKNYSSTSHHNNHHHHQQQQDTSKVQHYIYVDENDHHYSKIIEAMPPGILVLQLSESILYPNAGHVAEKITRVGKTRTRNGNNQLDAKSLPWNESLDTSQNHHHKPLLGAVVLDMHAVRSMDSTGLQALTCVKTTLERYAGQAIEWHFVGLQNPKIRHHLLSFGFGTLNDDSLEMVISSPNSDQSHSSSSSMMDKDCPIIIHTDTLTPPTPQYLHNQQQQQNARNHLRTSYQPNRHPLHRSVLLNNNNNNNHHNHTNGHHENNEKSIVESWRQVAFNDVGKNRFSSMNSLFDPMEMDIDPYYASIEIHNDPHDQLPIEKYPCFHWDVDTAVRTICDRWHSKKAFEIYYQV
ncbi:unnamed protein product [Cunninghamella blakesleeana]